MQYRQVEVRVAEHVKQVPSRYLMPAQGCMAVGCLLDMAAVLRRSESRQVSTDLEANYDKSSYSSPHKARVFKHATASYACIYRQRHSIHGKTT